jgi:catechol 2,3-dioxygenase-like lactoylglutathione lyase family enzyme
VSALGFHHVALHVHDVERVAAFYADVLGLREIERHFRPDGVLRSIWLSASAEGPAHDGFLAVEKAWVKEPVASTGFSMVAFRVDPQSRRSLEARLAEKGIAIEKMTQWTIYVRDPEGHRVGLSHHPHPPSQGS